jgi:hypothetical protein
LLDDKTAAISSDILCAKVSANTIKTVSVETFYKLFNLKNEILSWAEADLV